MKKCRACKEELPNEMFAKKQGRCNPCRAALRRKQRGKDNFYKEMVNKVPWVFINDHQLKEFEERNDVKVWSSRDCPPPLDTDMLKIWKPEIEKGLVKDVVYIEELGDNNTTKSMYWRVLINTNI